MDDNDDVVGFAMHNGTAPSAGAKVKARVLDVQAKEGVVDLSLRPELSAAKGKKKTCLVVGSAFEATVELVKTEYLVASLSDPGRTVGFAPRHHINAQSAGVAPFEVGQKLSVEVAQPPGPETGGRLILGKSVLAA